MEVTELYNTAKTLIDEAKKIQPEISEDSAVFVIFTAKQHIYAGVNGIKVIKGNVLPASAEYNAVLAMVSEDETSAKQAIKLSIANGNILRPEKEGIEMLCRVNPANNNCYIVLSADEVMNAGAFLAESQKEQSAEAVKPPENTHNDINVVKEPEKTAEEPVKVLTEKSEPEKSETAEEVSTVSPEPEQIPVPVTETAQTTAQELQEDIAKPSEPENKPAQKAEETESTEKSAELMEDTDNMSEEMSFEEKFGFAFDDTPAEDAPPVPTLADQQAEEQPQSDPQNPQEGQPAPDMQNGMNGMNNMMFQQGMPNGNMYGDPSQMMNNPMMQNQMMNNMQGMNQGGGVQQMQQMMQQMLQQISQQNPQMAQQMMEQFNKMNQIGQQMNQMNQMNQMMNQMNQMQQMMNQNNPQYAQPIAQPYGYNPNAGSVQFGQTMYQNANPYYQGGVSQPLGGSQPLNAFPAQSSHYGASSHYLNNTSQSQPVSSVAITSKNGSKFKDRFNKYVNDEPIPSSPSSGESESMSMSELMKKQRDQKKNAKMSADFKKKMKDMGY